MRSVFICSYCGGEWSPTHDGECPAARDERVTTLQRPDDPEHSGERAPAQRDAR